MGYESRKLSGSAKKTKTTSKPRSTPEIRYLEERIGIMRRSPIPGDYWKTIHKKAEPKWRELLITGDDVDKYIAKDQLDIPIDRELYQVYRDEISRRYGIQHLSRQDSVFPWTPTEQIPNELLAQHLLEMMDFVDELFEKGRYLDAEGVASVISQYSARPQTYHSYITDLNREKTRLEKLQAYNKKPTKLTKDSKPTEVMETILLRPLGLTNQDLLATHTYVDKSAKKDVRQWRMHKMYIQEDQSSNVAKVMDAYRFREKVQDGWSVRVDAYQTRLGNYGMYFYIKYIGK